MIKPVSIHHVPQFNDQEVERATSISSLSEEGFLDSSGRFSVEKMMPSSLDIDKKRDSGHRVGDMRKLQEISPWLSTHQEHSVSRSPSLGNDLETLSISEEETLRENTQLNRHSRTFEVEPLSESKNKKSDSTNSLPERLKTELLGQFEYMARDKDYLDIQQLTDFYKLGYPKSSNIDDGVKQIMYRFGRNGRLYENGFLLCYEQSWIENEDHVKNEVLTRRNFINEQIRKSSNPHVRFDRAPKRRRVGTEAPDFLDSLTIPISKRNNEQRRTPDTISPLSTASADSGNSENKHFHNSSTSSGGIAGFESQQQQNQNTSNNNRNKRISPITEFCPELLANFNLLNSPSRDTHPEYSHGTPHSPLQTFWNEDNVSAHHKSNSTVGSMGSQNSFGGSEIIKIPTVPLSKLSTLPNQPHRSSEPDMRAVLRRLYPELSTGSGYRQKNGYGRPGSLSATSSFRSPIIDAPLIEDRATPPSNVFFGRDERNPPSSYELEQERFQNYSSLNDQIYGHPKRQHSAGTWNDFENNRCTYGRSTSLKTREELKQMERNMARLHYLRDDVNAHVDMNPYSGVNNFDDNQAQTHWQNRLKRNSLKKSPPRRASVMHQQEYERRSFNRPEFQLESQFMDKIERLSNKNKALEEEKEKLEKKLENSKNELNETNKKLNQAKNQLRDDEHRNKQLYKNIKKRDTTIDHQTVEIDAQKVEIERLSKEMEKLQLQQRRNETLANREGMSSRKYQTCEEVLECVNKVFGLVHLFELDALKPNLFGDLALGLGFKDSHYFNEILKSIVNYKSRIHELENVVTDYERRFNNIKQDPNSPPAQADANRKPFSSDNRARSMDERKRASTVTLGCDVNSYPVPKIYNDGCETGRGDYDIVLGAIEPSSPSQSVQSSNSSTMFAFGHMDVIE